MENELDVLNEKILELEMENFSNVDLRTFVTYLSLCNSNMPQAIIARELEISPVTLSKALNTTERPTGIKNEKWLRKLISLLKVANNPEVAKSWSSFLYQANLLACYQERINSIHIISNYLLSKNSGYTLSVPQDAGSIRRYALFTNQKKERLFVFADYRRSSPSNFFRFPREFALKNITCGTIVCYFRGSFNAFLDGAYSDSYAMKEWTKSCKTISVMLISLQSRQVESEAYLYDAENGLELPVQQDEPYEQE